jgi:hypothetical protein
MRRMRRLLLPVLADGTVPDPVIVIAENVTVPLAVIMENSGAAIGSGLKNPNTRPPGESTK